LPPPHRADVLVIGAGIAGASVAAELASHREVILLEAEDQPGYHTTGRSAAAFGESYGNATVRALTRASRAFLESPPPGFAAHPLLTPRAWMFLARADQLPRLDALAQEVGPRPGIERLSAAETRARVPILREGYVAGALWDGAARDVDVAALHQGYLARLRSLGGALHAGARVTALDRAPQGWVARCQGATFAAPVVVDAAGAWADEVGRLAGAAPLGLTPMRRTAILLDPPPGLSLAGWPLTIDVDEQFYFKPEAGKLLASPADETPSPPCDARAEELDVAVAVDRITTACDLPVHHVPRRWAGLRSFVADRSPVAGFDPRAPGLFWLAGQGGFGIQTAPALARCAAALVRGEPLPPDVLAEGVSAEGLAPARLAR
jgi:D-arginine dehydrogenase